MELNCPNCGAPKDGAVCAYCGTVLDAEAVVSMAVGKEVRVRFEHMGFEYEFTMCVERLDLTGESEPEVFYGDDCAYRVFPRIEYRCGMQGSLVPSTVRGHECLFMKRELAPHEMTT